MFEIPNPFKKIMDYISLKEILGLISQNNYQLALSKIRAMIDKNVKDRRLNLIYVYLLSETEDFEEAKKRLDTIKNEPYTYFIKKICLNLNNINELKGFESQKTDFYIANILDFDFKNAKKHSFEYFDKNPEHYLFSLICMSYFEGLHDSDSFDNALQACIKKSDNAFSAENMYLCLKNKLITQNWLKYMLFVKPAGTIIFLCFKMIIINQLLNKTNFKHFQKYLKTCFVGQKSVINESKFEVFLPNFCNFVINNLDDWEVYEFSIINKIVITDKNTRNYKFYGLNLTFDTNLFLDLLNTNSMKEQEELIDAYKDKIDKTMIDESLMLQYHLNNDLDPLIEKAEQAYNKNKTLFNLKTFLATLIATKNEDNLLLALSIAKKEKDFYADTYEIKLITLFLYRFFCMFDEVLVLYKELDIKNNLIDNCSYLWSDMSIKTKQEAKNMKKEYFKQESAVHKKINNTLQIFLGKGSFYHSLEMMIYKNKVSKNITSKELLENKILSKNSNTCFSHLLGRKCSFLFSKLIETYENTDFDKFALCNLYKKVNHIKPCDSSVCNGNKEVCDLYKEIALYQKINIKSCD